MDGIKTFVYDMIMGFVYGFDENVTNARNELTKDIFSGTMYGYAEGITAVIKPIALTIISICFLIDFIRLIVRMDVLKFEFLLRVFLKLVLAKVAIDISAEMLKAIYLTGADLIRHTVGAGNASSLGEIVGKPLKEILSGIGWLEALGLLASMFIAYLALWVTGIIVNVIAFSRTIEIIIMVAVSPIPVAFLPIEDGGNSMAKHFFMNFAGVVLQGLFIIIAMNLYNVICSDTILKAASKIDAAGGLAALGDISGTMLLGALVLIMTVIKSGSLAKSILNAA